MQVRKQVFVDELGLDPEIDFDGLDYESVHFLLEVDNKPVGTARWRETDEGIKIERLSILKEYRGYGFGHVLLRYVVKDVLPSKKKIYIHAPEDLLNFFIWNGFEIEGEEFEEAGTAHYKLFYAKHQLKNSTKKGFLNKLIKH
jgi:predicted GNAT family N-acyltransferase